METPFGPIPDRYVVGMPMAERHEYLTARLPRRRVLRGALVGVGALAAGPILWSRPGLAAEPPAGLHIAFGNNPQREVVVSWLTPGPVEAPALTLGQGGSFASPVVAESRTVAGTQSVYHHVRLGSLEPGTAYQYKVGHLGAESEVSTFTTAPTGPAAFRFTAFGDQGISANAQAITNQVVAAAPAFHFQVGDICYAYGSGTGEAGPTTQATWDSWFTMTSAVARQSPWMTTVGNHEMESGYGPQGYDGYLSRFTLPSNGPATAPVVYSFRYGNVAILSLDANDVSNEIQHNTGYTGGAQDEWLAATLGALRSDPSIDFVVAGFHHCAYCTNPVHSSDGGVRDSWQQSFDDHAVDLVINGHNHCYERTHPLKGGQPTETVASGGTVEPATHGTTYVTAGGGGQTAYTFPALPAGYVTQPGGIREPELAVPWSATRDDAYSFLAIDVSPPDASGSTTMTVHAVKADGSEIETFRLARVRPLPAAIPPPAGGTTGETMNTAPAGTDPPAAQTAATTTTTGVASSSSGAAPASTLPATGGQPGSGAGIALIGAAAAVGAAATVAVRTSRSRDT